MKDIRTPPWIVKTMQNISDFWLIVNISWKKKHFSYITLKISKIGSHNYKTKAPRYNQTRLYGHPLNMDDSILSTVRAFGDTSFPQ